MVDDESSTDKELSSVYIQFQRRNTVMTDDLVNVRMSDGCNLKVKIIGDDLSKPLMIANHGGPGLSTHKETLAWCAEFADRFRVLVFDMRGCGESDYLRPYTHKRWVDDVEELRQWAGADKFTMIGASHGGFITLEYTLTYPQHVSAIIIGDTAAQISHWGMANMVATALTDPRSAATTADPARLLRILTGTCTSQEDFFAAFGAIAPLYSAPPEFKAKAEVDIDAVLASATKVVFETSCAAMNDCVSRYDVRDRLSEIQIPAFVFSGRYDWITPQVLSEEVAKGIKGAKFVVFEQSGHLPALEEKTKFQREVRAWLDENQL